MAQIKIDCPKCGAASSGYEKCPVCGWTPPKKKTN